MHELFHTSLPPFSYWTSRTREVLDWLRSLGVSEGMKDGAPVRAAATLDAGPNIHLLVPVCDVEIWRGRIADAFPSLPVLMDREGWGAEVISTVNMPAVEQR